MLNSLVGCGYFEI